MRLKRLPQHRKGVGSCSEGASDHLAAAVNGLGRAEITPFICQRTKISYIAILPEHSVGQWVPRHWIERVGIFGGTDDKSVRANYGEPTVHVTWRHAQVPLCAVVPGERMANKTIAADTETLVRVYIDGGGLCCACHRPAIIQDSSVR